MAFVTKPALLPADFGLPPASSSEHTIKRISSKKKEGDPQKRKTPSKSAANPKPIIKKKSPSVKKTKQRTLPWK